jgi:hypothetical protein
MAVCRLSAVKGFLEEDGGAASDCDLEPRTVAERFWKGAAAACGDRWPPATL